MAHSSGWLAGVIHDGYGFYASAFVIGVVFNIVSLTLIGVLVPGTRCSAD